MNPDQILANELADALNKLRPESEWEFSTKLDICNCSQCKNMIIAVVLERNGYPKSPPVYKPFSLEEVRKRKDSIEKFAQEIIETLAWAMADAMEGLQ